MSGYILTNRIKKDRVIVSHGTAWSPWWCWALCQVRALCQGNGLLVTALIFGMTFGMTSTLGVVTCSGQDGVDFAREIRPILSNYCFECHGPDRAARQADLRLDVSAGLFAEAESGVIPVVPGQPDQSELLLRVTSDDIDQRMPPAEAGRVLDVDQVLLLRRWIQQGAIWQQHWSWKSPVRPQLPTVSDSDWPAGAIDCFVLARLDGEKQIHSPPAVMETLIRRVTYDLTGLPPSLNQLDRVLQDPSPDAYTKEVDRLLATPRVGEHLAWAWLDAARYGDTNGYQGDLTRTMWPWREWVIDAINANLPFDQFTTEQLAGDLLENATVDQQIASGFHRNVPLNGEGGRIAEESRVEYVVDRVETTATVWMGLTAGCARCHDHKYDSLTQREFYQLFAYFNNIDESGNVDSGGNAKPVMKVPVKEKMYQVQTVQRQLEKQEAKLADLSANTDSQDAQQWEQQLLAGQQMEPLWGGWKFLGPILADSVGHGHNKQYGPETVGDASLGYRDRIWEDKYWPDGKAVVMPLVPSSVGYAYRQVRVSIPTSVEVTVGADNAVRLWVNGIEVLEKITSGGANTEQEKITLELQIGVHDVLMKISNRAGTGGFYFETTLQGLLPEIKKILSTPKVQRTEDQEQRFTELYWQSVPELQDLTYQIRRLQGRLQQLQKETHVETMVMRERVEPRETYLLVRGRYDHLDKSEKLSPEVPATLPAIPEGAAKNRLGLARWLMAKEHPLTARVAVNRYWQALFGTGLVATSEDFGSRGEQPSHPDLLDWLATEYVRLHWDRKALLRKLVTTRTYGQDSGATSESFKLDPKNRLLGRGPRFRLPVQVLRDQALAMSGLLVETIGGPSVKPYQPKGIWAEFSFGKIQYTNDSGPNLFRRTLYTFWRRSAGPANIFDNSDRQVCSVRPRRTNTPLQALVLLNDKTYVEAARMLAQRILNLEVETSKERLVIAFRIATARRPTTTEQAALDRCLERSRGYFQEHPAAVEQLLAVGQARSDIRLDRVELASYASVMNVILNLDETVTRE